MKYFLRESFSWQYCKSGKFLNIFKHPLSQFFMDQELMIKASFLERQMREIENELEFVDREISELGKFSDNLEGLAHISELGWEIIAHPSQVVKENDVVKAQITSINGGQISLSLKALQDDPWQKIEDKYQAGQTVDGKTVKLSAAGIFVEIEKGIHGLVSLEESNNLNLGQAYKFEITSLSLEKHKMTLTPAKF